MTRRCSSKATAVGVTATPERGEDRLRMLHSYQAVTAGGRNTTVERDANRLAVSGRYCERVKGLVAGWAATVHGQ